MAGVTIIQHLIYIYIFLRGIFASCLNAGRHGLFLHSVFIVRNFTCKKDKTPSDSFCKSAFVPKEHTQYFPKGNRKRNNTERIETFISTSCRTIRRLEGCRFQYGKDGLSWQCCFAARRALQKWPRDFWNARIGPCSLWAIRQLSDPKLCLQIY